LGPRLPQIFLDLVRCEFALQLDEDAPFQVGELDDAGVDHVSKRFTLRADLQTLAADVADAEDEEFFRREQQEALRAGFPAQEFAVFPQ
jgi:hypothetical protein